MFENIAAIDIGSSSIKLITVKTGVKDFKIISMAYEDIDQNISNRDMAIQMALDNILKENNLKGYKILANLPMERVIIRNLSFPFSDIEKIAEALPYEAEENLPFKLDDLIMDFQLLRTGQNNEGHILLAATHKDAMHEQLKIFSDKGLSPIHMGLEANALYHCYDYFNQDSTENIIQLDIGDNKTILNIIGSGELIYTRCISLGLNVIYRSIADILDVPIKEAILIYQKLNIDINSYEENVSKGTYKELKITKQKFKQLYERVHEIFLEITEQLILSIKSFYVNNNHIEFNRLLLSGGGSNILGIGHLLSSKFDVPIISLPFIDEYKDEAHIKTQFPIVFGMVIGYLAKDKPGINFLKDEFTPDYIKTSRKQYYFAIFMGALSAFILLIYISSTLFMQNKINRDADKILQTKFRSYFQNQDPGENPVQSAQKILEREKNELNSLEELVLSDVKNLDLLKSIVTNFPSDNTFELKRIFINETSVKMEGQISSSKPLDDFKNRLLESKEYESVVLNTNIRGKDTFFSLDIKLKVQKKAKAKKVEATTNENF